MLKLLGNTFVKNENKEILNLYKINNKFKINII